MNPCGFKQNLAFGTAKGLLTSHSQAPDADIW